VNFAFKYVDENQHPNMRVISLEEMNAARTWTVAAFLHDPCSCTHGSGQHFLPIPHSITVKRGVGPCSAPGCDCKERDPIRLHLVGMS
jgi:hypothetical protein